MHSSPHSQPSPSRQIWLDILKGIGILCVVVGHITYNQTLARTIFMFHMPLFFLVGGWLHRVEIQHVPYLKKRTFNLLLPYAAYLLLLWPLELLIAFPDQRWTVPWMSQHLIQPMLLGGQLLTGFAAVFWFVTCYFLTQQLVHFLLRRYAISVCAWIAALLLVTAYLHAWLFPQLWLLWNTNTVLIAAPLYLIGYWARQRLAPLQDLSRWLGIFLAALFGIVLLKLLGIQDNTLDLKNVKYGIPLITLFSALSCVGVLAWSAQHLQSNLVGRSLAYIGSASMTLMFLHQFVQLMLAKKLGVTQATPRIVGAVLVCLVLHELFKRFALTRLLLLGVPADQASAERVIALSEQFGDRDCKQC